MGWDGIYNALHVLKVLFYKCVFVCVSDEKVYFYPWKKITFKNKFERTSLKTTAPSDVHNLCVFITLTFLFK